MSFLLEGILEAFQRIIRLDRELLTVLFTTLRVSLTSTLLASSVSLPLGYLLARRTFAGKRIVLALLKTALAFPTVVVALLVYAFITRNGPLGRMDLLFEPAAIVIGQVVLITPLVTALVHGALHENIRTIHEEAVLLGAGPITAFWKTILETRIGITTALMTGFARVVSEIGVSLMLGGNIRGHTRTMTTAIALETGQGNFPQAIALGVLLLLLVLAVSISIQLAGGQTDTV